MGAVGLLQAQSQLRSLEVSNARVYVHVRVCMCMCVCVCVLCVCVCICVHACLLHFMSKNALVTRLCIAVHSHYETS